MLGVHIDGSKRIFGFDLLRVFAIFCVIHGHGRHLLNDTYLEGFPWLHLPHGVDIFFVLTGFLICNTYLKGASKTGYSLQSWTVFAFWKRTALRILPNYYLILIINYCLVRSGILNGMIDGINMLKFVSFTQNLWYPFYDFFWESWSLAVQVWFYLLFPILIMLCSKFIDMKRTLLVLSFSFILLAVVYRIAVGEQDDSFWWDITIRKVVLSRVDCVFFGVLAAYIRHYYSSIWSKLSIPTFVLGIILFFIISYTPRILNTIYFNVFFLTLTPIYIVMLFPLIDRWKNADTIFGRAISYISALSYSMYLFNLMLIQIIDKHFSNFLVEYGEIKYLLFWLFTFVLSYLLHTLYENPIATLSRKKSR